MPNSRVIATIDLGSNSFHMLIARKDDDRLQIIDTLKETVRLRAGLNESRELSEEAQNRGLACLQRFAQRLRGIPPENIRVVGTNTLRRSKNAYDFLKRIEEILGVAVDVIGGNEEARLVYLGVATTLNDDVTRNLVVDIGGGSTEFIIGVGDRSHSRESRPVGCVSIAMEFFKDQVITRKRFTKACNHINSSFEGYMQPFRPAHWDRAIGTSGSIKAIAHLHSALELSPDQITKAGMEEILRRLLDAKELRKNTFPSLKEDRLPVFLGGFAVLYCAFQKLEIEAMNFSNHSLREGVLVDLVGRETNRDERPITVKRLMEFYNVDTVQAQRVREVALHLFHQVMGNLFHRREMAREILGWAADLHEIGLAIAHTGYHKHGAYIILNGDLDGFSQTEQGLLSFLVLNHRKRLKNDPLPFEDEFEWPLVFVFRLAFLLCRERMDRTLPDVAITWKKKQRIQLNIDPKWLEAHPLTATELDEEQVYWKRIGFKLNIND
jgi:exopolyphosphatase/guanosine-5'-triphosphate,3'-diphosphate pyrophosphatase